MYAFQIVIDLIGSQALLARGLGVQLSTVNNWIFGRNRVSPEVAIKMEKLTDSKAKKERITT